MTIPTPKTQYNWAGYLVTGSTGSFIQVSGSWIQPSVSCNATNADASTWAGIDGYVTSGTGPIPEQGGTTAWCISGAASYVAWYEDPLTSGFVNITGSGYTVKAGDRITANVTYSPSTGYFVITVMDKNQSWSYSPTAFTDSGALENSAECITERVLLPGGPHDYGYLADMGTAKFGLHYSGTFGCSANGTTSWGPFGGFRTLTEVEMVSYPSGSSPLAIPTSLSYSGTSFTVVWSQGA